MLYRRLVVGKTISRLNEDKLKKENLSLNSTQLNRELEPLRKELYWINGRKGDCINEEQSEENETDLAHVEYIL